MSKHCEALRVLVAEDSELNQRLAVGLLESQGHTVTLAQNGQEAVDKTEHQTFDLVLMDVEMPEMDGLAATRVIRSREEGCDGRLPIVAVSSSNKAAECLDAGMDAYLPKPLSSQELSRTLRTILAA